MNTPSENEFRELRRLLALKRHEQPPPGYFHNLSREIIAELKAERFRQSHREEAQSASAWITRFLERLQAHPAFAGACGAALCAVLIGGLALGESNDTATPTPMPTFLAETESPAASQPGFLITGTSTAFQPVDADSLLPMLASNDLPQRPSLFDSMPLIEPVTVDHREPTLFELFEVR